MKRPLSISIVGHISLSIILVLSIDRSSIDLDSRMSASSREVQHYIVYEQFPSAKNADKLQAVFSTPTSPATKISRRNVQSPIAASKKPITPNSLLTKLHQVLTVQAWRYRQDNIAGKVTLGFYLAPNGTIHGAKILQSSGYLELDNYAMQAVASIDPFLPAQDLLLQQTFFSVQIVFA